MELADKHCPNSVLTVNEMRTFLRNTEFQDFLHWLTGNTVNLQGTFRRHDFDHNGALDRNEMEVVVKQYFAKSPKQAQRCRTFQQFTPAANVTVSSPVWPCVIPSVVSVPTWCAPQGPCQARQQTLQPKQQTQQHERSKSRRPHQLRGRLEGH